MAFVILLQCDLDQGDEIIEYYLDSLEWSWKGLHGRIGKNEKIKLDIGVDFVRAKFSKKSDAVEFKLRFGGRLESEDDKELV